MGLNQCTFLGRLTRDPEIRYAGEAQLPIARFTLAVDRRKSRDGEAEADFFQCVAFDKRAEFAEKYLYSGIRVLVSGYMKNNNYTNKAGDKVYGMELQTSHIEFADGKRDGSEADGNQQTDSRKKPASSATQSKAPGNAASQSSSAGTGRTRQGASAAGKASAQEPGRQRAASGRSSAGRSTAGRTSGGRSAPRSAYNGDAFMNIPEGVEDEGLPFN